MKQEVIEKLAFSRQVAIIANPNDVSQTFDVVHLKAIHGYLFQDSLTQRQAGRFRLAINDVHAKNRTDTYSLSKPFFYQPKPSEDRVDAIIKNADNQLSNGSSFEDKTKILANLYAELDYEHPFVEGNSRTLRTFCQQLANKHGIRLDWSVISDKKDEFYRARDVEIAKRNMELKPENAIEAYMLEEAKRHNTHAYIATQISLYKGRYLAQIIDECCRATN